MAKKNNTEVFKGFTPETMEFLKGLKENNYKEWFEAHREVYEQELLNPFKALITTLSPAMHNIDPAFELRPHRAMSRIYRDVRFSKDKSPYKTGLWLTFQVPLPREEWMDYPGYFFELKDDGYIYGMGLFQPRKKVMDAFREEIGYDAEEFQRVTQQTVLDRGFVIGGDEYKRPIANDLGEYYQQWIQRKGVYVVTERRMDDILFSPKLVDKIREDFVALEWLYNFFKECSML
ncbi:DUF2461 domain-containing protein [Dysgonomonas sp. 25]|uniref:DUF2461 domain-containing protein n=1 Tax=Dysgonomonas sp. 25 TaxID=2302933 RepID=UPI0013D33DED|nr:DUF2461 domain-containing protein [Dysgonomonas sp. 25]NDV68306.1 DUF2461 domain-containing protein [Dysgonomonas sp. 25]